MAFADQNSTYCEVNFRYPSIVRRYVGQLFVITFKDNNLYTFMYVIN